MTISQIINNVNSIKLFNNRFITRNTKNQRIRLIKTIIMMSIK